jgi:hypothetical protein
VLVPELLEIAETHSSFLVVFLHLLNNQIVVMVMVMVRFLRLLESMQE